jgi:hypothetical protein
MDDVITDAKDVTPEWLTAVLRTNGHLDHERVTAVKLKASRQTTISNTHHLEITYSAVTPERSPSKLFLKLSKPGFDSGIAARFGQKESQYYNVIAKSNQYKNFDLSRMMLFVSEKGRRGQKDFKEQPLYIEASW